MTKEEAERLAGAFRDWTGWRLLDTLPMEARLVSGGEWKIAVGDEIRGHASRARGLRRKRGWCVRFEAVQPPDGDTVVEAFPAIVSVNVFEDGSVVSA